MQTLAAIHRMLKQPLATVTVPLFKRMMRRSVVPALEKVLEYELEELDKRFESGDTMTAALQTMEALQAERALRRSKL